MTLWNNAAIGFEGKLTEEVLNELKENYPEYMFSIDENREFSIEIEEVMGDLLDDLNEIVEKLAPYGVKPHVGEMNRYYGDYDGYDVFVGDKFESFDDEEYGEWLAERRFSKQLSKLHAAVEDLLKMPVDNLTQEQSEKIEAVREAFVELYSE